MAGKGSGIFQNLPQWIPCPCLRATASYDTVREWDVPYSWTPDKYHLRIQEFNHLTIYVILL